MAGIARARISATVAAPGTVLAKDLQGATIGRLESVTNDAGALTVSFLLDPGAAGHPAAEHGGKFLLGLRKQGRHVCCRLSAAEARDGDEAPQRYPGMLGEAY